MSASSRTGEGGSAWSTKGVALLVLDMQNTIVHSGHGHQGGIIGPIAQLRDWAHQKGVPVFYTVVAYLPSYADASPIAPARKRGNMQIGQPDTRVIPELEPWPQDVVIIKKRTGAFYGNELELTLRGMGVNTLIITGTSTHRAVESTVREGHSRDFRCIAVADACASGDQQFHDASLRAIGDFFGEVMTSQQVMECFQ